MLITSQTLFAFVDLKDPFTPGEVTGEELTRPILSLMGARHFNFLFLFCTPHTRENAEATRGEVEHRHKDCHVTLHELPVSDPKDYSPLMGQLAGLDLLDHPLSMPRVFPKLVRRCALDALDAPREKTEPASRSDLSNWLEQLVAA